VIIAFFMYCDRSCIVIPLLNRRVDWRKNVYILITPSISALRVLPFLPLGTSRRDLSPNTTSTQSAPPPIGQLFLRRLPLQATADRRGLPRWTGVAYFRGYRCTPRLRGGQGSSSSDRPADRTRPSFARPPSPKPGRSRGVVGNGFPRAGS
jgi:hypothetical protein